jgi:restriction system protein
MTYLDAAYTILKAAGQPLHFEEITQRALTQKLIAPQGQTPEATMGSRLYTDTKQEGSHFVRAGHGRFGLAEWQPKGIDAHVQEINQGTRAELTQLLQTIPPERFEALIRDLLVEMGFDENTVKVTPYSADGGIDVTGTYRAAGLTEVSAAVQAKKWKGNVGAPVVTQLRGSLQVHQHGIIITTSDFSRSAREEADAPSKTHIGLINGKELVELLIKHKVGVANRTLEVATLDEEYWGVLAGAGKDKTEPKGEPAKTTPNANDSHAENSSHEAKKPVSFTLLGQEHSVSSWRDVLLGARAALATHHGATFADAACAIKGRTRYYVAVSPDGMIAPAQIPGTELWVEANQSAKSVVQVVGKLLAAFGHTPEDFALDFA